MRSGRRPLRLAFPVNDLRIGGAELRALRLVERLARDQFESDFLSLSGEGALDQCARDAGARVEYLGSRPVGAASLPVKVAGRLTKFARYASHTRSARYDIVNAWLYPADVYTILGRAVTRSPVIVTGRFDLLPRNAFGSLSARVDAFVNPQADAIVANSEVVAAHERGRPGVDPAKLHVIHNGVEPVAPLPPDERRRVRSELGAGDEELLIGSVGMLREVKRHGLLIDAFADVARTRPEVRLAIIGEGPMRASMEQQLHRLGLVERVRLPGAKMEVGPMLDAFDVVASSSQSEGLPNALLEAAAAGRPIVTTAAGGAVEVVLDGTTGLVVPVGDRESLAGALERLLSDAELRRRFGTAAREHMEQRFGMDRFVKKWANLYERLAIRKGLIEG